MMLSRQQLNEKYGRELTDEEVIAEQKLMYETDEVLEGTGLECGGKVQTKDGEGIITGHVKGRKGVFLMVTHHTVTRCYEMKNLMKEGSK